MSVPEVWSGLVDDAAVFPPGDSPLDDAVAAFSTRRGGLYADQVGAFVGKGVDGAGVGAPHPQ